MSVPSASSWANIALLVLGLCCSWLRNIGPLWLVMGPVRFVRRMLGSAAQESGYSASVAGDGGGSVGILQWSEATWTRVSGRSLDDRTSPFWSGFYAGDFWTEALLTSWLWWPALALPVFGYASVRYGWTHGTNADDAAALWTEAVSHTSSEGKAWGAYAFWLLVTGPLSLLLAAAVLLAGRRKGAR